MSTDTDPLLRAIVDQDPACPDGRALVAMGRLVREHSALPHPTDLGDSVLARLESADEEATAAIDAIYDRGDYGGDAVLARLGELVREAGRLERPVDLAATVLRRIRTSERQAAIPDSLDGGSRWRIWSAVVAGHVAALLAFAIVELSLSDRFVAFTGAPATGVAANAAAPADGQGPQIGGNAGTGAGPAAPDRRAIAPALPPRLPTSWSDIQGLGSDLFLPRRFPELRREMLRSHHLEASAPVIAAGLAWLEAQQDPDSGFFGRPSGLGERDLAAQSLAVLALLGEGLGDKPRTTAARRGLEWLRLRLDADERPDCTRVAFGLAGLALVEGGLLLGDEGSRLEAEHLLAACDSGLPMQPGAAGLGGFTLVAVETAQQGGLHVPGRLLTRARQDIGRSLPSQDDVGRLGLAAFARLIYGHRDNSSTTQQLGRLGTLLPAVDGAGRVDPLGWFFATLAMREAGGRDWERWAEALQGRLLPLFTMAAGQAHVEAGKVRYAEAGGEVFATSLALINLQAPYRYLPLAR
jgi:hypothetical protein